MDFSHFWAINNQIFAIIGKPTIKDISLEAIFKAFPWL